MTGRWKRQRRVKLSKKVSPFASLPVRSPLTLFAASLLHEQRACMARLPNLSRQFKVRQQRTIFMSSTRSSSTTTGSSGANADENGSTTPRRSSGYNGNQSLCGLSCFLRLLRPGSIDSRSGGSSARDPVQQSPAPIRAYVALAVLCHDHHLQQHRLDKSSSCPDFCPFNAHARIQSRSYFFN